MGRLPFPFKEGLQQGRVVALRLGLDHEAFSDETFRATRAMSDTDHLGNARLSQTVPHEGSKATSVRKHHHWSPGLLPVS